MSPNCGQIGRHSGQASTFEGPNGVVGRPMRRRVSCQADGVPHCGAAVRRKDASAVPGRRGAQCPHVAGASGPALPHCQYNGAATSALRKVAVAPGPPHSVYASLGPQPQRCGRRPRPLRGDDRPRASMGPQPQRCGRRAGAWAGRAPRHSFNGAATSALRKGPTRASLSRTPPSFNGAATSALRKACRRRSSYRTPSGFNGAATSALRKADTMLGDVRPRLASMGPQLQRCGRREDAGGRSRQDVASMGPQLQRCGRVCARAGPGHDPDASMGPQLQRCGRPALTWML